MAMTATDVLRALAAHGSPSFRAWFEEHEHEVERVVRKVFAHAWKPPGTVLSTSENGRLEARKVSDKEYIVVDRQEGFKVHFTDGPRKAKDWLSKNAHKYLTPAEVAYREAEAQRRKAAEPARIAAEKERLAARDRDDIRPGRVDNGIQLWVRAQGPRGSIRYPADFKKGTMYTLWQRVGDTWVIERTFGDSYAWTLFSEMTPEQHERYGFWPQGERPAPNVKEYRYGAVNRPIGYATAPKGVLRVDPPILGEPRTRHGVAVYDHPLTDEEVRGFELVPYMPLASVITKVLDKLPYRESYVEAAREGDTGVLRSGLGSRLERLNVYTDIPLPDVLSAIIEQLAQE